MKRTIRNRRDGSNASQMLETLEGRQMFAATAVSPLVSTAGLTRQGSQGVVITTNPLTSTATGLKVASGLSLETSLLDKAKTPANLTLPKLNSPASSTLATLNTPGTTSTTSQMDRYADKRALLPSGGNPNGGSGASVGTTGGGGGTKIGTAVGDSSTSTGGQLPTGPAQAPVGGIDAIFSAVDMAQAGITATRTMMLGSAGVAATLGVGSTVGRTDKPKSDQGFDSTPRPGRSDMGGHNDIALSSPRTALQSDNVDEGLATTGGVIVVAEVIKSKAAPYSLGAAGGYVLLAGVTYKITSEVESFVEAETGETIAEGGFGSWLGGSWVGDVYRTVTDAVSGAAEKPLIKPDPNAVGGDTTLDSPLVGSAFSTTRIGKPGVSDPSQDQAGKGGYFFNQGLAYKAKTGQLKTPGTPDRGVVTPNEQSDYVPADGSVPIEDPKMGMIGQPGPRR